MTIKLFIPMVLLTTTLAVAEEPNVPFIMYRDHGRVAYVTTAKANIGNVTTRPVESQQASQNVQFKKFLACERLEGTSTCTVWQDGNCFHVHWKLDLPGPDWLYYEIKPDKEGTGLTLDVTDTTTKQQWIKHFGCYEELRKDKEWGELTTNLMRRLKQNPALPEITYLRDVVFAEKTPEPDLHTWCEIYYIVQRIDNPDWKERDKAQRELYPYTIYLNSFLQTVKELTPEQRVRVEAVAYSVVISGNLEDLLKLKEIALKTKD